MRNGRSRLTISGSSARNLVLTVSPQRIIVGGGVMAERLFPLVRLRTLHWLGGYIDRSEILSDIERYIVPPALGSRAGVLGALCLAVDAGDATARPAADSRSMRLSAKCR